VPVALGGRLATRAAVAVVLGLALLGAATLHRNPLTPWRVSGVSEQTARLKTYASRGRLERVHRAIQVFYLDGGTMPPRLESLASAGHLHPLDLLDPWGRPYGYELRPDGYTLAGLDGSGSASPALRLTHRFSPAQRMVLQGGVIPAGL
jgi:hypothetical protein